MKFLSIIIPVYNEAPIIQQKLQQLRQSVDSSTEIIVVDGGSEDESLLLASELADYSLRSAKGRANQMNAGAKVAHGQYLLFLHIDTQLPASILKDLSLLGEKDWGFFYLSLSGQQWAFRVIETMINIRSHLSSVATGDQCIFISKNLFDDIKGYQNIPLMEDVEITKRLRKIRKPKVIKQKVVTSSRRWEQYGILKTIGLMWRLRFAFFMGADPNTFSQRYYPKP